MTGQLDLATFDGDVTLYDDGKSLEPDNEVISRIVCKSTPSVNARQRLCLAYQPNHISSVIIDLH
jgi:hypothetical protein